MSFFTSKVQRAAAADLADILGCMQLCEKPGSASITVKSLVISALIGAVWKDSDSLAVVKRVVAQLQYVFATV